MMATFSIPEEFRVFIIDLVMAEVAGIRNNLAGYAQEQQRIIQNIQIVRSRRPQAGNTGVAGGGL